MEGHIPKHENLIEQVWNPEKRRLYEEEIRLSRISQNLMIEVGHEIREMPRVTREHLDAVAAVIPGNIVPMMKVEITEDDIKQQISKLKDGKAPGPDGLKPELFKIMKDSEICINDLKISYRYILESGEAQTGIYLKLHLYQK